MLNSGCPLELPEEFFKPMPEPQLRDSYLIGLMWTLVIGSYWFLKALQIFSRAAKVRTTKAIGDRKEHTGMFIMRIGPP